MRSLLIVAGIFFANWGFSQEQEILTRKEIKFVNTVFPADTHQEGISIPADDTTSTAFMREGDRIYQLGEQDQLLGYLLSTRAPGRFEYFDYLVAYAPDLSILGLKVTNYRSSHGAAICQKKWLSQFVGLTGESLRLGKEIDAVSGGTISASSLVLDLDRCYQLLRRLKETGQVD